MFVDQPVTYLYNTLHYYYNSLKERTEIKKKLVQGILGNIIRYEISMRLYRCLILNL